MAKKRLERLAVDTIRTLAMDAVEAAKSGHPGTPMALAPPAYVLWNEFLRYNPAQPDWPNRDRFVLSCGHASMLLYALLHLAEVRQLDASGIQTSTPAVSLDDIRRFRQLHSRCAGHPEYGLTTGVEITTGPLGQGVGASVGMAMAARWLAARYNQPDYELFNFKVYALCSDGDLMEGVAAEAASLAGHLKLANLCWLYDDNQITIEGSTDLCFSEDVAKRFAAYGWRVLRVGDANNLAAVRNALKKFQTADRPTLIIIRSVIAYGSPNKAGSHEAHGAPLGEEEIRLTKAAYGWPTEEKFLIPEEVRELFRAGVGERGRQLYAAWNELYQRYQRDYPLLAEQLGLMSQRRLPEGWDAGMQAFPPDAKGLATRASSGKVLNQVAERVPSLLGGSADLAPSNNSRLLMSTAGDFSAENHAGRNLHFGIREHAMGAILNGLALCNLRPYGATFLVFSDYLRPALRLAAMMKLPVFYIFTHDSIGVGEDGPTHQPIEHLAALRAVPNLMVFRPADANEVAETYRVVLSLRDRPAAIVLSRQNLPTIDREKYASASGVQFGGYVLADAPAGRPEVILIASGSEVVPCLTAREKLLAEGISCRVVSLPCWELFDAQDSEYRNAVLPPEVKWRVAVELGVRQGWEKYLGDGGVFIGMNGFGASAPANVLLQHFGITPVEIAAAARKLCGKSG